MTLSTLDWGIILGFFAISLGIGIVTSRRAGKNASEFFLSGRNMPWWLLGVSMVATTFSADTPNLVTDIVRRNGVAGNWAWWAFLLTGMLTIFVYARLWRRSNVLTDLEFYELRYSGKPAAFLRGFRAVYLGLVFNIVVMASVCLAAIKLGAVLLGLSEIQTLLIASVITVLYSTLGGLRGILLTDFFQFFLALFGAIAAAIVIVNLPEVGGLSNLLSNERVVGSLPLLPDFSKPEVYIPLMIVPLAVQWWAAYYPGAEPGGGGYIAQRMLAAKDETNAMGATLFFNIAHYALRPWPWILIALASLVMFPMDSSEQIEAAKLALESEALAPKVALYTDAPEQLTATERDNIKSLQFQAKGLSSLADAFPAISESKIGHDLAYPAMLRYLGKGLLGLVIASLIAAFMSTISTHLNWGASYLANDFYRRFVKPEASEKEIVNVGRIASVVLMALAALLALGFESALDAFNVILLIGAGTGLIFILRWFWWRINAYSEISAMIISFVVAIVLKTTDTGLADWQELLIAVGITTAGWLLVTYLTPPTEQATLTRFYRSIQPARLGWEPVIQKAQLAHDIEQEDISEGQLPLEIACMFVGCITVYAALFATGYWIYGHLGAASLATTITLLGTAFLYRSWGKLQILRRTEPFKD